MLIEHLLDVKLGLYMLKRVILIVGLLVFPSAAFADSTEWMKGPALYQYTPNISKAGKRPVRVNCKDSGSPGLSSKSIYVKFELAPENGKRWYWWLVWHKGERKDIEEKMSRSGYHIISEDKFRRKSGTLVQCLLYSK